MRSKRTRDFRQLLKALPKEARVQAYRQFNRDPYHPSLHFKRLQGTVIYSVRIGIKYRALGRREADDLIVWFWIGPHAEYNKLTKG